MARNGAWKSIPPEPSPRKMAAMFPEAWELKQIKAKYRTGATYDQSLVFLADSRLGLVKHTYLSPSSPTHDLRSDTTANVRSSTTRRF